MRILIIKISSLGDVLNALPALTDAGKHIKDIQFDWVVENSFSEIPTWHPLVKNIIKCKLRTWRKRPLHYITNGEIRQFFQEMRSNSYDFVIDAQGLIKTGLLTYFAKGIRCGYDKNSAWEPLACLAYDKKYAVKPEQHAITRIRQLFAKCLDYPIPDTVPDCGITEIATAASPPRNDKYCVFLHGTARAEKLWPENHWAELITLMKDSGYKILLPWGNDEEKQRAERLALNQAHAEVLPKLSLTQLANILTYSRANVAVDTGLAHLAAALNIPTIALYGPTKPELNGTAGKNQQHLKANSMQEISSQNVYQILVPLL